MASTDPKTPGTVGYSYTWTNIENAKVPDNVYATQAASGTISASNFGFNIPSGSIIKGIILEVYASTTNYWLEYVQLFRNGVGTVNKASENPNPWSAGMAIRTYGGPTDLWGTTWTPAQINESTLMVGQTGFGTYLGYNQGMGGSCSVDGIRITVYYAFAPSTDTTSANPYTGRTLSGKILTDTVTPKVRINGVLLDNKAHEMLLQPVTVLVTTKTTYEQAKGK